jgi:glutamate-1-semialdehyde 2,1-aminomutase
MTKHLNSDLNSALEEAQALYLAKRPITEATHKEAVKVMPGGNTRTVLFHGPVPLRIAKGEGGTIEDVDGHRYLNLLGEYTAGIYGHSHPKIQKAIKEAVDGGLNLTGHNTYEHRLAKLVCDRFDSIELVRFTNSGTEANLMGLSTARCHTGRDKVMVMDGGYHGGLLYFGGGGIPTNAPYPFVLGQYNDIETTRAMIRQHADELACVLVEPMMGSGGCIVGDVEFLQMLRDETKKAGALLIFDEVMTSRFAGGGAQGLHGITPDMTTLGKYIGGGMSFGAFGGRADIMVMFDPTKEGHLPHAGTFNNNTLTMAAGIVGIGEIFTEEKARELHDRGTWFTQQINQVFQSQSVNFIASGLGSLINIHSSRKAPTSPKETAVIDQSPRELLFLDLLEAGFYIANRGFIALSLEITDQNCLDFVEALNEAVQARKPLYM